MTRHQKRTLATVPTLALLSTMAVCDAQPLAGARPIPPRRVTSAGLAVRQPPAAPHTAVVLPAAANFTEVDGQRVMVRHPLFTPEDARRAKARTLLFTPEDQRRTVWRFAATRGEQKPAVAPGKPARLQLPRR